MNTNGHESLSRREKFVFIRVHAWLIVLVRFYQVVLAPLRPLVGGTVGCCRYSPSCSEYAVEALRRHGAWHGTRLAARRILRCHPWGNFGHDPVPLTVNRKF
ncbi:MAG: membrane protein insertion efficiency factor YidD [Verrucomicrobiales bacterium]|jgi:putative membrane protein insertion efficiency factor|nr:membrane protein insertion efficiency factor YidD [Verrucomicrobiales bacterium]